MAACNNVINIEAAALLCTYCTFQHIYIQGVHLEGTLIYADVGPAALRPIQPAASISRDLDDSRVEYAQLNLKIMEQELSRSNTAGAKSGAEVKFDGRYG